MTTREKSTTPATIRKRAPRKTTAKEAVESTSFASFVDPGKRMALIAEAAYFRAEKRGFAPGGEAADWLAAEAEVDAKLLSGTEKAPRV
jgi:hypothetical protein